MAFKSEADLAAELIRWLEKDGWKTYREVVASSGVIDIVAEQDGILWAIETKNTFSLEVLEQAHNHLGTVHYVSVAVPKSQKFSIGMVRQDFCRRWGIGVLTVKQGSTWHGVPWVDEAVPPRLARRVEGKEGLLHLRKGLERMRSNLHEDQTTSKAGSGSGEAITPYKRTMRAVREYIKTHGPSSTKEILAEVKWHWSSAAGARRGVQFAMQHIEKDFVKIKRDGKTLWDLKTK